MQIFQFEDILGLKNFFSDDGFQVFVNYMLFLVCQFFELGENNF